MVYHSDSKRDLAHQFSQAHVRQLQPLQPAIHPTCHNKLNSKESTPMSSNTNLGWQRNGN
eukprot:6085413-Amphidinium_carterae.1